MKRMKKRRIYNKKCIKENDDMSAVNWTENFNIRYNSWIFSTEIFHWGKLKTGCWIYSVTIIVWRTEKDLVKILQSVEVLLNALYVLGKGFICHRSHFVILPLPALTPAPPHPFHLNSPHLIFANFVRATVPKAAISWSLVSLICLNPLPLRVSPKIVISNYTFDHPLWSDVNFENRLINFVHFLRSLPSFTWVGNKFILVLLISYFHAINKFWSHSVKTIFL